MLQVNQTTFNFFFFPQNENARRGVANDKYQKMRAHLEDEKGKTAFLKEQIIKSKRMFFISFSYSDLNLCILRVLTMYFAFSDLQKPLPRLRTLLRSWIARTRSLSTFRSWIARTRSLSRRG